MEDKILNKIINKITAKKFIDRLEWSLALAECEKGDAYCDTLKDAIKNIKEYHKID